MTDHFNRSVRNKLPTIIWEEAQNVFCTTRFTFHCHNQAAACGWLSFHMCVFPLVSFCGTEWLLLFVFTSLIFSHWPDFSFAFPSVAYLHGPWVDRSWAKLVSLLGRICVQAMKVVTESKDAFTVPCGKELSVGNEDTKCIKLKIKGSLYLWLFWTQKK